MRVADDATQLSRAAKLVDQSANAVERLDQPILSSINGGPIASDQDEEILRPREALYRVRLIAEKSAYHAGSALQPVPGRVQIAAQPRSIAGYVLDRMLRLLRQEASLTN